MLSTGYESNSNDDNTDNNSGDCSHCSATTTDNKGILQTSDHNENAPSMWQDCSNSLAIKRIERKQKRNSDKIRVNEFHTSKKRYYRVRTY